MSLLYITNRFLVVHWFSDSLQMTSKYGKNQKLVCRRLLVPLLHAEKGRLRNAVPNRVSVSCCSSFEFCINYGCDRAVT